ncbi:MAG: DUF2232 domain-containing protein [Methylocystis sp.]|uniref:DUF2232 domain-containing protein n=1 Tax=Methylocystis sp. TaxID=1911079 RepID=UPI003D0CDF81
MPEKSVLSWPNVAVSVLGGVAAAVIFAVVARGGVGGLLLAHLAPLPIMIVAFAFGLIHGGTAAILATVILSFWPHPVIGMAYGLLIAAPAWSAVYAALGAPRGGRDRLTRNLPGWAALAPAIFLAAAIILWLIVATIVFGSLDDALNPIRARAFILLDMMVRERDLGDKIDPTTLSGSVARAVPAFVAAYGLLIHVVNLWLAARIAEASKLLGRPWPDIAREFRLPRPIGGLFLSGVVLTFFEGLAGAIGLVLATTLGLLLAFQGLAVAHIFLRGSRSSALVLAIIYFTLGLLGWPILFFAALGVADLIFNYRDRKTDPGPTAMQKPD